MAYAAVASLSHTIDLILNYHHDYISLQFSNQITSIHKHTILFESFLEDFPERANNWEETIREVSDRADEIIELLLSDSLLESKSTVGSSKAKLEKGKYEVDYSLDELERASEEMESIANRLKGKHAEAMGGSDEELMKIISRLVEGSSALEIIPIVGVAGIGKTTLARNAYNHPVIKDHFNVCVWSLISQEYSWRGVISELLRSVRAKWMDISVLVYDLEYDVLIDMVHKNLFGRRYLIVLDDIWSLQDWGSLKLMFPDPQNGSRIILTTRLSEVASIASIENIHKMRLLDEDQSWNVVRENIFKGDPCPSQLEYVGKEIARKCRGHPLSIEVVSGILAAAGQTAAAWEDILENMNNTIAYEFEELVLHILSLSYTYLPHHLRPCFLYLASFPEDHEIHVSKLIKLWVAEGFLNQSEYKTSEEIGEECVEDLVRRSLVSVCKKKSNGGIKRIAIHDLMRDFCLRQAQIENFIIHVGGYYTHIEAVELRSCRRVCTSTYDDILEGVYGSTIRTIMLNFYSLLGVQFSIGNVELLRILDSSNAYHYHLPEEVFELFHLRYLAFHSGWFGISEAISNLENLQTLIIRSRERVIEKLGKLPEGIWRMPQLRHLIVFPFEFPIPDPEGVTTSALENLQTLSTVLDFICSRENLKIIPNLKKLALLYTKNLRDVEEDLELHNLIYLHKLEILKMEVDWSSFVEEHKMSTRCAFPTTLKKLNLFGVQLPWEDMKIVGSLPNLQVLKLRENACIGETWETSEGGFSQLTYLLIEECNLVHWITKASHFPTLKCLVLRYCSCLLEVPEEVADIFSLEVIELDEYNPSLLSSVNRIKEDRSLWDDYALQIRIV